MVQAVCLFVPNKRATFFPLHRLIDRNIGKMSGNVSANRKENKREKIKEFNTKKPQP